MRVVDAGNLATIPVTQGPGAGAALPRALEVTCI